MTTKVRTRRSEERLPSSLSPRNIRPRSQVKRAIVEAFRAEFPTDTIDVSDGYGGFVHVLVVSRRFDRMSPREKQDLMWRILERTLTKAEMKLVSLLLPLSPAEIK